LVPNNFLCNKGVILPWAICGPEFRSIRYGPGDPFLWADKPALDNSTADCSAFVAVVEKYLWCADISLVVVFGGGNNDGSVLERGKGYFVAD
jgi:hypothetical protein